MKVKEIKYERRLNSPDKPELYTRAITDEATKKRFIEGYASVFETPSLVIFERGKQFKEIIQRNAFDEVLKTNPNVIATVDHSGIGLARTKNNSLTLSTDDYGLKYRFEVPNTTAGNDLYEMTRSNFFTESSFVFSVDEQGEGWEQRKDGNYHIVKSVRGLFDISVVTDGAYGPFAQAEVSERVSKRALELEAKVETPEEPKTVLEPEPVSTFNEVELLEQELFILKSKL